MSIETLAWYTDCKRLLFNFEGRECFRVIKRFFYDTVYKIQYIGDCMHALGRSKIIMFSLNFNNVLLFTSAAGWYFYMFIILNLIYKYFVWPICLIFDAILFLCAIYHKALTQISQINLCLKLLNEKWAKKIGYFWWNMNT